MFSAMKKADVSAMNPQTALETRRAFHFMLNAFGIILPAEEAAQDAPAEVKALAEQRWQAKQDKNWAEADRLRGEVTALGWTIKDRKDGYDLVKA